MKGKGYYKTINPTFCRFVSPRETEFVAIDPIAISEHLENFEQTSRFILKHNLKEFERVRKELLEERDSFPNSSAELVYEDEFCKSAFKNQPITREQRYAVHLYLYSHVKAFAKDFSFTNGTGGSGPYQFRKDIVKDVELLMKKDPEQVRAFVTNLLQNQPVANEILYDFLRNVALMNWNDLPNPAWELTKQIFENVALSQPADIARMLTVYARFPGMTDVPLEQSAVSLKTPFYKIEDEDSKRETKIDSRRRDYGELLAVAVDSEQTVEVDDAFAIEETTEGKWIHVFIADLASFTSVDSYYSRLASKTSSSLYLPQGMLPMLPLQYGMRASLAEGKANRVITFSAKLAANGDIAEYRITPGIINNLKRTTYEAVDQILDSSETDGLSQLKTAHELARLHLAFRKNQGQVDFDLPERKITVADVGGQAAINFKVEEGMKKSADTVREMMIIAGRVAAMYSKDNGLQVPFRYHLAPSIVPSCNTLFEKLQLLQDVRPSAVDLISRPHWAMGLESYCKATSPLRRYFDLLLHQQLYQNILDEQPIAETFLRKVIPKAYRHEQYLKRLQNASKRYWTLRHLRDVLDKLGSFEVDVLPLKIESRKCLLYVQDFALLQYASFTGVSSMKPGVSCKLRILNVDVFSQSIDFQLN